MKCSFVRLAVLTCLAIGLFYGQAPTMSASAQTSACASYGEVKPNENPSFQQISCLLTDAALAADIPPEVVKAIAAKESSWQQFNANGEALISEDGGIGIMQITNQADYDQEKLKTDIAYNINAGIEILNSMYERTATDLPRVKEAGRQVIENWYFPVMAYNGTKPVNSPIYQLTGEKNKAAYQEQVFALIEKDSFLTDTQLGQFQFSQADFKYDSTSDSNIEFIKKEYTLAQMHDSTYLFKAGDQVVVTKENVNVRSQPGTSQSKTQLAEHTTLIITGDFLYDQDVQSNNQFVWYPVKTADQKVTGYISSAYIAKANPAPAISFTDVSAKYQEAVEYVVAKGINGFSPTIFGTDANIKRVDAAVMLVEVLDLDIEAAPASGFTDVPARAVKYVNALKAAGITTGKTATTLDSYSEITRGELAIWIQRAFELQASSAALPFNDVTDRYAQAVSALVNNEVTNGTSPTTFGTQHNAKRGDYALFLYRAAQAK